MKALYNGIIHNTEGIFPLSFKAICKIYYPYSSWEHDSIKKQTA